MLFKRSVNVINNSRVLLCVVVSFNFSQNCIRKKKRKKSKKQTVGIGVAQRLNAKHLAESSE